MNCLNVSTSVISGCLRVNIKECKNLFSIRVEKQTGLDVEVFSKNKSPICTAIAATNNLSAKVTVEDGLLLNLTALYKNINVDVNRIDKLNATHSFVCGSSLTRNYFLVQEGLFILSDGKKFEVIKDEQLSK